jgi:hypothetical protein
MQTARWEPIVAGVVGFFLCMGIISALLPAPRCGDGWRSPSIGRQGACSHHGGVHQPWGFLLFPGGIAGGFGIWYAARRFLETRDGNKSP